MANRLNGDDDKFITGEARQVWDHLIMHPMRQVAFNEVDKMIADGHVTSSADVHKVIKHPPTNGEYRAGEEFEGSLLPGEKLWETDADIALFAEDAKTEFDNPLACTTGLVAYEAGDDIPEWQEGNILAKRLARLRRVRQEAQALRLRPAVFQINRDITNLERGRLKKNTTKSKLNAVFLRSLRADQEKAKALQNQSASKVRGVRAKKARVRCEKARLKAKKFLKKCEKHRNEEAILSIPFKINSDQCGTAKNYKGAALRIARMNG